MKKTIGFLMITVVSLMVSLTPAPGLALFESYGSLEASSEVTRAFDGYRMDMDLNYYFSGSATWPDAIIGVNKAYRLDSSLWRQIMILASSPR